MQRNLEIPAYFAPLCLPRSPAGYWRLEFLRGVWLYAGTPPPTVCHAPR